MFQKERKHQFWYSLVAIAILAMVYVVAAYVVVAVMGVNSTFGLILSSTVAAVFALVVFDNMRTAIDRSVERMTRKYDVDYDVLNRDVARVFLNQEDFYKTTADIGAVLEKHFHCSDVRVVLRIKGKHYYISNESDRLLARDNPIVEYMKKTTSMESPLYRPSKAHEPIEADLRGYLERHRFVYLLPLILERRLFGWISFHDEEGNELILTDRDRAFLESVQPLLSVGLRRVGIDRALNKRIEELVTLQKISHTVNSTLNVKETLESVMDAIMELTQVDRALLYLRDDNDRYFSPTIGRGTTDDIDLRFKVDMTQSIFKTIVEEKVPLIVDNVFTDDRVNAEYAAQVKTKSFVLVPLVAKEKVIGIIGVDNRFTNRPVSEVNVDLLVTLANQAAIALTNSRLYEKTQRFNEHLQEKVQEATAHLEQLLEMKSHFLTVASHQLRTPTTIVRGMLSMIDEDPNMPLAEQRKLVGQATVSINRLERIISELLSATALEDTTTQAFYDEMTVGELIDTISEDLKPLAEKRGIELLVQCDVPFETTMQTDRFKIEEAIANVVDNAIRYTPKGSVTIQCSVEKTELVVQVIDTGVGLTPDDAAIIFEKFQRGDNVTAIEPNGTGLGLFITKRIMDILGGTIVMSSEGRMRGTTCIMRFPMRAPSLSIDK